MVVQLGIGAVRLVTGSHTMMFEVEGGFAEVTGKSVILLAEEAMKKEELSERHIRHELDELSGLTKPADRLEAERHEKHLKKLRSRLKIAAK